METVKLKNGAEALEPVVRATMLSVDALAEEGLPGIMALYELQEICNNPAYKISDTNLKKLQESGLLSEDGKVHGSVKDIFLSSIEGTGLDQTYGCSPVASTEVPQRADGNKWGSALGERNGGSPSK